MKRYKVYKVNVKPNIYGLDLPRFSILCVIIVLCVFVFIPNTSFTTFLVLSVVIGASYIILSVSSDKGIIAYLLKDKLPNRIRNSL